MFKIYADNLEEYRKILNDYPDAIGQSDLAISMLPEDYWDWFYSYPDIEYS